MTVNPSTQELSNFLTMAVNILLKRSATASKRPVGASMAFGELNLNYDAATGGLYYKNALGTVVKVGPCQVSATAPNSTPGGSAGNSAGEFWFDTSTSTLKIYDGTAFVEAGGSVQGVTGTAPITVDNTDPLNPIISASAASTSATGVVQLNDTTASTSTTEALTANQGRNLQQQIDALAVSSNLTLAGTLDASTGFLVTVTTEGTAQGFAIGSVLPSPAAGNSEFFVIATVGAASYTPPGGSATVVHVGDWFLSNGTVWNLLDVGFQAPYATTTDPGIVQLATDAEVQAGVELTHAVTSSGLQSKVSDSVSTTSSSTIASSTAVKSAYDAGVQGQTDAATALSAANAAQGDATQALSDAAAAQGDATQALSDAAAAQGDATQALSDAAAAQATANAALPLAGGTMTGNITFQDAGEGVFFSGGSSIIGISDATGNTNSDIAASSTAVKAAYDAAIAAQDSAPNAAATVLFVNGTTGNNATAARGTAKPYATITAALAAASEGDTIYVAPGTYSESVTLNKGVILVGTFVDQAISCGPKISGTFTVNISGAGTRNWAVSNLLFMASSAGNNSVVVSNNSFGSGGIGTFTNCFFQQFSSGSLTEQCFATSGTWTRSLYLRNCTFDGNFTHNAGTTAGASGYLVIDNLYGIAGNDKYYKVMTGTCEFRNPSNALAPVLHTGGAAVFSNVLAWISNVAATTTIFGGTGFAYKGTSAGLGQAVAYFTGQGVNVVEGSTWGKLSIGSNVVYAFGNVIYDTSLATLSGIPLTVAAPNPNGVLSTMARPQWSYLTTASSVAAANQLGTVIDSTTGTVYSVSSYDAGTF